MTDCIQNIIGLIIPLLCRSTIEIMIVFEGLSGCSLDGGVVAALKYFLARSPHYLRYVSSEINISSLIYHGMVINKCLSLSQSDIFHLFFT